MTRFFLRTAVLGAMLLATACGDDTSDPSNSSSSSGAGGDDTTNAGGSSADGGAGGSAPSVCGNGVVESGEGCDDSNTTDLDGCNDNCEITGSVRWNVTIPSSPGLVNRAKAITVDDDGNVYVVGDLNTVDNGDTNIWLAKFDVEGNELWSQQFDGSVHQSYEYGFGVALTPAGDVIVIGTERQAAGQLVFKDTRIIQVHADGSLGWDKTLLTAEALSVAVADDGAIYLGGRKWIALPGYDQDAWIARLSADGDIEWEQTHDVIGENDLITSVAVRGTTIAITGMLTTDVALAQDMWVATYDSSGQLVWDDTLWGVFVHEFYDRGTTVTFDTSGGLLAAGTVAEKATIHSYSASGEQQWSHDVPEIQNFAGNVRAAVDASGHVIVSGTDFHTPWIAKLDVSGAEPSRLWEAPGGVGDADGRIDAIAIGPDDSIAVAGLTNVDDDTSDIWIRVYAR